MTTPLDPSRREFLATSALGLAGISGLTMRATTSNRHADEALLYIGTYTDNGRTDGIHLVSMNASSGALRLVRSFDAGPNPSFLAIHPDGRTLFAVNEVNERNGRPSGAVTAFTIAADSGALTRINEQPSEGGSPCFVSVDRTGRVVLVANYMGGNVALLPIGLGGALEPFRAFSQHLGTGPNAERQEAAHAHCIVTDPSNRFALVADLGIDRVAMYRLGVEARTLERITTGDATARPGAGPRHLAFHPRLPLVYVANELDSTVTTLRLDAERATLTTEGTRSTLPDGWSGASFVADIHVAPDARTLYVSNRGHNSIAVFAVDESSGALSPVQHASTEGDWPRNFSLDPTARWLLVANQRSGSVVVMRRDEKTGRLSPSGQTLAVAAPVCVRFRAHVGVTT